MKSRLFYFAENLDVADRVREILDRIGLKKWNFHVLCKDDAGIFKHQLHSANVLQTRDLWRQGERGAVIGFFFGLAAALLIIGVLGFFRDHYLIASAVIILTVTMHGAWIGGIVGMSSENYQIRRFHKDIENGRILLILDVSDNDRKSIQPMLEALPLQACGKERIVTLPFDSVKTS